MTEATLKEKRYMTSKDAGALLGYTHDYISRLCRQGKMSGIQKGREWFVTKDEIEAFKKRHEVELQEKKVVLSKKFSQIRLAHEAKKREARQSIDISPRNSDTNNSEIKPLLKQQNIKFKMPRELVAIAVLAVLVLVPNIFNKMTSSLISLENANMDTNTAYSLTSISQDLQIGIQETIFEQSTVVEPVAAVFSFMPYLADGYWSFFITTADMFKQTYISLNSVGNLYLAVYIKQGEIIYDSIGNLNSLGATVLQGYELMGESFVVGSHNVVDSCSKMLNIDSNSDLLKKN